MADPARAKKRTLLDARKENQADCRETPCLQVQKTLAGNKTFPPCNLCVHERAIKEAFK